METLPTLGLNITNLISSYVCSKNVKDYQHFGETQDGKCPLHDNVEDRHEREVEKAADDAMAKVRTDNPGLSDADLMVKVSDRVKQAEDARKVRGAAAADVFPYHMVGNALVNRPNPVLPLPGFGAHDPVLYQVPPPPPVFRPAPQYVPHYPAAPLPIMLQRAHPVQFVQPIGYPGPAVMQQHSQYVVQRPFVPLCPHCHLYHPANQHC